ncbi:MAG: acyl-CoA dehydrogenase family protein [Acidimicrobiales bacterium]
MRAALARAGTSIDHYFSEHPMGDPEVAEVQATFAEVQAAKAFLTAAAVRVVDRALALSGGAGYLAGHRLAKAWRDVRAGAFMHPLGDIRWPARVLRTAPSRTAASTWRPTRCRSWATERSIVHWVDHIPARRQCSISQR